MTGAALVVALLLGSGLMVTTAEAQNRGRDWGRDRNRDERYGPWRRGGDRDRDWDRDDDWNRRNRNSGWWGNSRNNYPTRGYAQAELQRGFRNGLKEGRDDAQDRDSFNPSRHSSFRDGNSAYRQGFANGYRQGFREYARYRGW